MKRRHMSPIVYCKEADESALGVKAIGYRVKQASNSASVHRVESVLTYSTRTRWCSYARPTEIITLMLDAKALVSELRILNKNASAVTVSVAVQDSPDAYVEVERREHIARTREVAIRIGFMPCCFIRITLERQAQRSIEIYGIRVVGVPCFELEDDAGPALCNVLSHSTEYLLYGPSLPASLPRQDVLSDHVSGSKEWMRRQQASSLDAQIARLEAALFDLSS